VVLSNGSVVTLHPWQQQARAVLEGWLLGQAGGSAIADLLLGVASPAGKLAETVPLHFADNPTVGAFPGAHGHVRYGEGLLIGYRWYDAHQLPVAYPFGHGLSYTTFDLSDLDTTVRDDGADCTVEVAVTVTNTGRRAGAEIVQVYVHDAASSVYRPEQELKAFAKVTLEPDESTRVRLHLDTRAFAFWHTPLRRWVVEAGAFQINVGTSSRDHRLTTQIELSGEDLVPALALESTAAAWLKHPVAGPRLRAVLGTGGPVDISLMLEDPQHGQMMSAIPMVRLARFPGFPIAEEDLPGLAEEANAGV
jgi:beta-glucosidase